MASSNRIEIQVGVGGREEGTAMMMVPEQSIEKIKRIPSFLRSQNGNNNDEYDPKVVSLGPYHHGKPELQLYEGFKHKVLEEFISGGDRDVNFYRNKLLEVVDAARRGYASGSTDEFGDSEFVEMMLLDACFLLYFLLSGERHHNEFKYCLGYLFKHIGHSGCFFMQHDTFLFENQVPLWIVDFLFTSRYGNTIGISWNQLLVRYCQRNLFGVVDYKEDEEERHGKPLHILEAFHMQMVTQMVLLPSTHSAGCWPKIMPTKKKCLQKETFENFGYVFRSVMDLKSKGIHFAPSDNVYSVMSIQFESNYMYGKLKLPIWCATTLTKVFFTNMIAYEMCSDIRCTQLEVISYVNFMKSLIVCSEDVKELREKRIIQNTLGDDMEVVQLFKGLKTYGLDNSYIFKEVKLKIQEHYDSKAKTWMAELLYTYLKSPWSIIALFAACVLLILTSAQTYAAFNQHN
nr:UPF0481 protein At3g47200-like [Ipomoea batatas]GMD11843.1 UPF0481 protein At3g47200-like [Ipomoea batatas]